MTALEISDCRLLSMLEDITQASSVIEIDLRILSALLVCSFDELRNRCIQIADRENELDPTKHYRICDDYFCWE